jgi:hypothetical protein
MSGTMYIWFRSILLVLHSYLDRFPPPFVKSADPVKCNSSTPPESTCSISTYKYYTGKNIKSILEFY